MGLPENNSEYQNSAQLALEYLCNVAGYDIDKIRNRDRHYQYVAMRRVVSVILRKYGFSFHAIGLATRRNHATIVSYFRGFLTKIEEREVNRVLEQLGGFDLGVFVVNDSPKADADKFDFSESSADTFNAKVSVSKIDSMDNIISSMSEITDSFVNGSVSVAQLNRLLTHTIRAIESIRHQNPN